MHQETQVSRIFTIPIRKIVWFSENILNIFRTCLCFHFEPNQLRHHTFVSEEAYEYVSEYIHTLKLKPIQYSTLRFC